ncbi:MAG: cadmium-translocating P-type ATPase [Anaerolineae bacterium]|nr:cadmium-translocating P-type ATPase [Anaerolineae bacterium]
MPNGASRTTKQTFHVQGLHCIDCADRVRAAVSQVHGLSEAEVDHATGTLTVYLDTPDLPVAQIAQAVRTAGYRLSPETTGESEAAHHGGIAPPLGFLQYALRDWETRLTATAGLLALVGLALALANLLVAPPLVPAWAQVAVFAAAIGVGGWPIARHAYQELWLSKSLGINVLVVVAVIGATILGEWAEAAIVVVLFSLGEALEGYATERARQALSGLLSLAPPTALKMGANSETSEVPVENIEIGDRVLVRPGDRISVDGIVQAGQSAVDQSPITGESMPVEKGPGDEVYAGTINSSGALEVQATHLAADNTLSRMVKLVQEAQSRQAPVQRFIDRFARVYTPSVAAVALLVASLPPLLLGQPFWGEHGWLMRALQMLVIACPCALVISTPVSLVSAMTHAASRGVLIKGGRYLEALSRVRVFAFDKTGTLTEGRPVVSDVVQVGRCPGGLEQCGLPYAAALEAQSTHPVARAVLAEAEARRVPTMRAEDVAELGGRGIRGSVDGVRVTVASHAHFDERIPHHTSVCDLASTLTESGKTVILVQHDDEVCTLFGVTDMPRPSSKGVIAALRADGGIHTVMLTGDNAPAAAAIAKLVGVDEVRAELLPEDKLAAISALSAEHGPVAMVGDGVNDAPALARADVGIAMGGAGSARAMETADIVLMGDDLEQLPFIVGLSRRTRAVVTANIVFALAVKAVIFALAAAGLASMWLAVVADVGTSVAVILNGMRLRK